MCGKSTKTYYPVYLGDEHAAALIGGEAARVAREKAANALGPAVGLLGVEAVIEIMATYERELTNALIDIDEEAVNTLLNERADREEAHEAALKEDAMRYFVRRLSDFDIEAEVFSGGLAVNLSTVTQEKLEVAMAQVRDEILTKQSA